MIAVVCDSPRSGAGRHTNHIFAIAWPSLARVAAVMITRSHHHIGPPLSRCVYSRLHKRWTGGRAVRRDRKANNICRPRVVGHTVNLATDSPDHGICYVIGIANFAKPKRPYVEHRHVRSNAKITSKGAICRERRSACGAVPLVKKNVKKMSKKMSFIRK